MPKEENKATSESAFTLCDSYYIGLRFGQKFDMNHVEEIDLREPVAEFCALIDV